MCVCIELIDATTDDQHRPAIFILRRMPPGLPDRYFHQNARKIEAKNRATTMIEDDQQCSSRNFVVVLILFLANVRNEKRSHRF